MDIVVTIPKSEYRNDDLETAAIQKDPSLVQFWTLQATPRHLKEGERVYFVKRNRIESSMRVIEIKRKSTTKCTTTGRTWSGGCQLFLDDLRMEPDFDFRVKGFQGFRYLKSVIEKAQELDWRELEDLMGVRRPKFERRGGAWRQI